MTEQPGSPGPDSPVRGLAPVIFELRSDDGNAAVYEAVVNDEEPPDSPVYTLTVTVASSVRLNAGPQLQVFLETMRVGFELLPGPVPPDDGPGPGTFNIGSQLDIEFGLARLQVAGRRAVAVTVQTPTGIGQAQSASDPADATPTGQGVFFRVGPNLDHHWHARRNHSFTATVTPTSGSGTIRNPVTFVALGRRGQLTAREVIVHGNPPGGMDYLFNGRFWGPN
jgi:hypothetical protein